MAEENPITRRNTVTFGVLVVLLQIGISIIYGLCNTNSFAVINITSIVTAIFLALLTVAGSSLKT